MVSLEDLIKKEEEGKTEEKKKKTEGTGFLDNIWKAKSTSKKAAEYKDHALNWDKKESTGKIIKGLEGLSGNLDRAVIDLGVGICQKIAEFFKSITEKKTE